MKRAMIWGVLWAVAVAVGPVSAAPVPDTGVTKCYDGSGEIACPGPGDPFYGQDGNYTINPRSYTKLDSSANPLPDSATSWSMVRDNVTGLVWEVKRNKDGVKNYSDPHDADDTYTWYNLDDPSDPGYPSDHDTKDFIDALNSSWFGGFNDWRLPSIKELVYLVDYSILTPGPTIATTYFPNTVSSYYWSSTTNARNAIYAWFVNFYYGSDGCWDAKSGSYYVRAVRGGQSGSLDHLVINGDGTVSDTSTCLMWQQDTARDDQGNYDGMTWEEALAYCDSRTLGGHTDWRLPTTKELRSLADYNRYDPAINTDYFANTMLSCYWSSTTCAYDTYSACGVHFDIGDEGWLYKSNQYYVRAVRGGQPLPDGGSIDLPKTGQTTCYDSAGNVISCEGTGQDGESQTGVAWPDPRFTDNGDGTVTDHLTGLMWLKDANCLGKLTWREALDKVADLNANPGSYPCGGYTATYSDWALPNVNELESLYNAERSNSASWLNGQGFVSIRSYFYWSSTTNTNRTGLAWVVDMAYGFVDSYDKSYYIYVWPVRAVTGSPPAVVWKTGQTQSYAARDDGALRRGASWPAPRFTDNLDGTVTDTLTELMWLKDANCFGPMTWQEALDKVAHFNANPASHSCVGYAAGYTDWRLPNKKELHSLTDFSKYWPALPQGDPFVDVQSDDYCLSTTHADHPFDAWVLSMDYGYVNPNHKSNDYYVWPVRGGQSAPSGVFYVNPKGSCAGHLPCYQTIQGSMDAAGDGDTILVCTGDYNETIVLNDPKSLKLLCGRDAAYNPSALFSTANALQIRRGRLIIEGLSLCGE